MFNLESRSFIIFLAEDNRADVDLLRLLLSEGAMKVELHSAKDGDEASDFLFKRGKYEKDLVMPDLIMMDLNLPRKDGMDLLRELKADKQMCKIPVVMWSTSSGQRDINEAYCLGASAFVTKPTDVIRFQQTLNLMVDFFFGSCRLATKSVLAY